MQYKMGPDPGISTLNRASILCWSELFQANIRQGELFPLSGYCCAKSLSQLEKIPF